MTKAPKSAGVPALRASPAEEAGRQAIVDIGSNSVRLVVFDGPARSPFVLFNEKIAAGLGASLSTTGAIETEAMDRGIAALSRFAFLAREMGVGQPRCIATAAVRDASNGPLFLERARAEAGIVVDVLTGEEEGRAAGYGVISAITGAHGIVGDLGGGSLELAHIRDGEVHDIISLPLGVLRLDAIRARGKGALGKYVAKALKQAGWKGRGKDLPFYMVGGSWRAVAHLDMQIADFPLPVIHNYRMRAARAGYLVRVTANMSRSTLKRISTISTTRAATIGNAAALLAVLVRELGSSELVASAHGLREGLLYQRLSLEERLKDPLLAAAEAEGESQGRFPGHGKQIDRWIAPLFEDDRPEWRRLRRAACLLGDVGWRANPDFRAERGLEIALHGNWVGIDGYGRAMLAQALHSNFGGGAGIVPGLTALAAETDLARAAQWGLAIRLAQRLSGGVAGPLEESRLGFDADRNVVLHLSPSHACLHGETVMRRLKHIGQAMGAGWSVDLGR